jgi:hypothetical protein
MSAPRPIRELVATVWSWDLYWEYMRVGLTAIPAGIAWVEAEQKALQLKEYYRNITEADKAFLKALKIQWHG